MASSASELLLLELMADGEDENTWGQKTNVNLNLVSEAIAKRQAVTLGGTDVTLSDTQWASSQARSLCIALNGTLSANVNVIVPSRSKMYLITNGCSGAFTATVKTAAGTGIVVEQGTTVVLYCDGTNVIAVSANITGTVAQATNALQLGGVVAANYMRKDAANVVTSTIAHPFVTLTDAATVTLNVDSGQKFIVTLAGNRTLSISGANAANDGQSIELWVVQDAGGNRTLTWPASVNFEGGQDPILATAAGGINRFLLTYNHALTTWIATTGEAAGGGATASLIVGASSINMDLYALAGSPGAAITVNVLIQTGVLVQSTDPLTPAIDTRGFAAGSVINLVNLGYVIGKGGRGGQGGSIVQVFDSPDVVVRQKPGAGQAGGTAIMGPGASRTLNIANVSGFIWGGGGGGGGGGATNNNDSGSMGMGGGGGGGAGSGEPGIGASGGAASVVAEKGGDGTPGSTGRLGEEGTGGAGQENGSGGSGGDGGDGGDFGAAGEAGESPTAGTRDEAGGAAGAAGAAVDPNGGTINFSSGGSAPHVKGSIS